MFGSGNVTSTWGSNQQNQQQQPSAFGQPTGFGSGGKSLKHDSFRAPFQPDSFVTRPAFGSTPSAFGQPQQQPQANPMFGNLGGASTTGTTGTGFGASYSSFDRVDPR